MLWRAFSAAALTIALSVTGAAAQDKVVLKVATWVPPVGNAVRGVLGPLADRIEKDSGGAAQVQRYWGGSLGRSPFKQFDFVKDGIIDIGWHVAGYTPGLFPQIQVFELPFVAYDALEGSLAIERAYEKGLFPGLEDVKVLALHTGGTYGVHSKTPIKRLSDLKGMKVSSSGTSQAGIVKHFGGAPIALPANKIPEALNRGVIDACLQGWTSLRVFGLQKVTSYHYEAPLGMPPFMVIMNKRKYESLPAKVKAAIDKNSGEPLARFSGLAFARTEAALFKAMQKDPAHHVTVLPRSEYDAAVRDLKPLYDERLAAIPNGRKVFDEVMTILADIRAKAK